MGSVKYRADIDGLRAIAVLAVVFCHAHFTAFGGGFLGVDIFFVISGFLITRILMTEQVFSGAAISRFYVRRIRRIMPALGAMLLACTVAALVLYSPFELKAFGRALLAGITFTPNLYFMRTVDYFAAGQGTPLLHLWSLGVEEQFYILFPLCFLALWGWKPKLLLPALAITTICSLAFSQWLIAGRPQVAFYFTGSRVWELALGAIAALLPARLAVPRVVAEGSAMVALALLLVPIFIWDETVPWPGLYAAVPCLGTAFLLWLHDKHPTYSSRLLSNPAMVSVGLISYSLYLWHWPIFTFYERWALRPVSQPEYLALIVAALAISFSSLRWVERPFRKPKSAASGKPAFILGAAVTGCFLLCGAAILAANGLPQRFSEPVRNAFAYLDYRENPRFRAAIRSDVCFPGLNGSYDFDKCFTPDPTRRNVVLWGDSYAMHFFPGLQAASAKIGINLIQATAASCRPLISFKQFPACDKFNQELIAKLDGNIAAVIVSTRLYGQPDTLPLLEQSLQAIVAKGIEVILLGPSPEYNDLVPFYVARQLQTGDTVWSDTANKISSEFAPLDRKMREIAMAIPGVSYVSVRDEVCGAHSCPIVIGSVPMQFDEGHLTIEGSDYYAKKLWPKIAAQLK